MSGFGGTSGGGGVNFRALRQRDDRIEDEEIDLSEISEPEEKAGEY